MTRPRRGLAHQASEDAAGEVEDVPRQRRGARGDVADVAPQHRSDLAEHQQVPHAVLPYDAPATVIRHTCRTSSVVSVGVIFTLLFLFLFFI